MNSGSTISAGDTNVVLSTTGDPPRVSGLMDPSVLSWDGAPPWEDHQLEIDWAPHHPTLATEGDALLASYDATPLVMDMNIQVGRQHEAARTDPMPGEDKNYAGLVITKLSELSMALSRLRSVIQELAKMEESSSGQHLLLNSPASFDLAMAWLSSTGNIAADMTHLTDKLSRGVIYAMETTQTQSSDGLLRDVFSASHRLVEIIYDMKLNNITDPENESEEDNHTVSIIRHLVMACDALLLEIFAGVVMTLKHEASTEEPMSRPMTTVLSELRLVLVVNICSYLTERQDKAIDQYLGQVAARNFDAGALHALRVRVREELSRLQQRLRDS